MSKFDSFLSYAGEDTRIASEIAGALKSKSFRIWYAPISLNIGDKLLDSIEKGMQNSKSCILLISPHYLNKGWTNYEMDTFIRRNIESDMKILPLWHNVDKDDVEKRHIGLSDIFALRTDIGLPMLIKRLASALARFAPTLGVIPSYESPKFRFLQGRGEINIGDENGPATSLWEFIIHSKDSQYPLYLDGSLYSKEDLLFEAAQLLPHIPDEVESWVGEEGRRRLWDICTEAGVNPKMYE